MLWANRKLGVSDFVSIAEQSAFNLKKANRWRQQHHRNQFISRVLFVGEPSVPRNFQ
jgi:hypothetical protein